MDFVVLYSTDQLVSSIETNYYFGPEIERSIELFIQLNNNEIRNAILTKSIIPAFKKLVSSLYNVYNFTIIDSVTSDELIEECLDFLVKILYNFKLDKNRGKSFSYFTVVAKNWFILRSKNSFKTRACSIEEHDPAQRGSEKKKIFLVSEKMIDDEMIKEEEKREVIQIVDEIKKRAKNEFDKTCIEAICLIFENIDNIDFLNKRAIFYLLREITKLDQKKISYSLSRLRKLYKTVKKEIRKNKYL